MLLRIRQRLIVFLLAIIFPIVVFWGVILDRQALGNFAMAWSAGPWKYQPQAALAEGYYNPNLSDQAFQFVPWSIFAAKEMQSGNFPLWNPNNNLGRPFHANGQSSLLWPTRWLLWVLPGIDAYNWGIFLDLWLAGVGMFFWLTHRGHNLGRSAVGAISFQGSHFIAAWLGHPHLHGAALLPWLFLSVDRFITRPCRRTFLELTLLITMLAMTGHVETSYVVGITALAYGVHRIIRDRKTRSKPAGGFIFGGAFGAVLLAALLSAPAWLPTLEYITESRTFAVRQQQSHQAKPTPTMMAITVANPWAVGDPGGFNYWGDDFYNESGLFFGWAALASLLLIQRQKRRRSTFFWYFLLAAALALQFRIPLITAMIEKPLGLFWFNTQRLSLVSGFALINMMTDNWPNTSNLSISWKRLTLTTFATLLVGTIWFAIYAPDGITAGSRIFFQLPLIGLIVTMVFWGRTFRNHLMNRIKTSMLVALQVIPLMIIARQINPSAPITLLPGDSVIIKTIQRGGGRLLPLGWTLPPEINLLFGLNTLAGYDALEPQLTASMHAGLPKLGLPPADRQTSVKIEITVSQREKLRALGVDFILAPPKVQVVGIDGPLPVVVDHHEGIIYRIGSSAMRGAWLAGHAQHSDADVAAREPQLMAPWHSTSDSRRYRIPAGSSGILTESGLALAGWRVSMNGQELELLGEKQFNRAVLLPPSADIREVVFYYDPASWRLAWLGFAIAALVLLLVTSMPIYRLLSGKIRS